MTLTIRLADENTRSNGSEAKGETLRALQAWLDRHEIPILGADRPHLSLLL